MEILFGIMKIIGIIWICVIAMIGVWSWSQCKVIEEEYKLDKLNRDLKNRR